MARTKTVQAKNESTLKRGSIPPAAAFTHPLRELATIIKGGAKKPKGGRGSRQKGDRFERELIHIFQDAGIAAERVPMSGSARGTFGGRDVNVPMLGRDHYVEVKHYANGFAMLYGWLATVDFLIVRADRSIPLAVLPLSTLIDLIKASEAKKS